MNLSVSVILPTFSNACCCSYFEGRVTLSSCISWPKHVRLDPPPCCRCWARSEAFLCPCAVTAHQSTVPRVRRCHLEWGGVVCRIGRTPWHCAHSLLRPCGRWWLAANSNFLLLGGPLCPPSPEAHWNQLVSVRRCAHIPTLVLLYR